MHEKSQTYRLLFTEEPTDLLLNRRFRRVVILVLRTESLILERGLLTFPRIIEQIAPLQIWGNIRQSLEQSVRWG